MRYQLADIAKEFEQLAAASLDRDTAIAEFDRILNLMESGIMVNRAPDALKVAHRARDIAHKLEYPRGLGYALGYSGFAEYLLSNHDRALEDLHRALPIMRELQDRNGLAHVLSGMSGAYLSLGNYEQALESALECLKLTREVGNRHLEAWSLQGIGMGYHEFGDYAKALDYHRESLQAFETIEDQVGYARALSGIGTTYQALGRTGEALEHHTRALEIFESLDNHLGISRSYHDIGLIHQARQDFARAEECLQKSLQLREQIGIRQAQSTSLIALGILYTEQDRTDKALDALHRALTIAMEIKARPRIFQANKALSTTYERRGEFEHALLHYKEFQLVKEEVQGDQATTRLKDLQVQHETENAQHEAELNRLKNVELREKNEQLQQLLNEIEAAQHQLIQSEKMAALGKLVAGLVHEVNSPLGAMQSLNQVAERAAGYVQNKINESQTVDELQRDSRFLHSLRALKDNNAVSQEATARISRIVDSLKSFARLDRAQVEEVDLHEGLEATLTLLDHEFRNRIEIVKNYGDLPRVSCHPGELNQVFMNLLTNAAQAIEGAGRISITSSHDDGHVAIVISDTGRGIPPEQMKSLFDPGFSRTGSRVKAGMGLLTSYNIIRRHQGEFVATSEVGNGSTFTITLPVRGPH